MDVEIGQCTSFWMCCCTRRPSEKFWRFLWCFYAWGKVGCNEHHRLLIPVILSSVWKRHGELNRSSVRREHCTGSMGTTGVWIFFPDGTTLTSKFTLQPGTSLAKELWHLIDQTRGDFVVARPPNNPKHVALCSNDCRFLPIFLCCAKLENCLKGIVVFSSNSSFLSLFGTWSWESADELPVVARRIAGVHFWYLPLRGKFLVFYCSSIKISPSIFTGDVQGGFQDILQRG